MSEIKRLRKFLDALAELGLISKEKREREIDYQIGLDLDQLKIVPVDTLDKLQEVASGKVAIGANTIHIIYSRKTNLTDFKKIMQGSIYERYNPPEEEIEEVKKAIIFPKSEKELLEDGGIEMSRKKLNGILLYLQKKGEAREDMDGKWLMVKKIEKI